MCWYTCMSLSGLITCSVFIIIIIIITSSHIDSTKYINKIVNPTSYFVKYLLLRIFFYWIWCARLTWIKKKKTFLTCNLNHWSQCISLENHIYLYLSDKNSLEWPFEYNNTFLARGEGEPHAYVFCLSLSSTMSDILLETLLLVRCHQLSFVQTDGKRFLSWCKLLEEKKTNQCILFLFYFIFYFWIKPFLSYPKRLNGSEWQFSAKLLSCKTVFNDNN